LAPAFFDKQRTMMLGEAVPNGARYEGKTLMIVSLLAGFGFAALLTLPGAVYTQEPAIAMAAVQPTQALRASQGQFLHPAGQMQAYSPFNAKKYETLSYLPELSDADIAKQIEYMIKNKWTPCLEVAADGDIYLNTRMGPGYYDNRYWSMYKLPMFGANNARDVIEAINACKREFPQAKIRVMGFDSEKQVQSAGFIVKK